MASKVLAYKSSEFKILTYPLISCLLIIARLLEFVIEFRIFLITVIDK